MDGELARSAGPGGITWQAAEALRRTEADPLFVGAARPALDPAASGEPEPRTAPAWEPVKRLLFRFAFCYLVLYAFPFPLSVIPMGPLLSRPYDALWEKLVPAAGRAVFGVEITVLPNGSGDTTFNYVQVFCYLVLAVAAALVWTLLDRRRPGYARLHEWLRIYVRFYLAAVMLSYGAVKVIVSQFPAPTLDRLLQPFGDASPMGLLWTFMGASAGYTIFTGAGEMLGGLLLTVRRTTLLGALVSAGVLGHVMALNFFYDVPVKLFSTHLLAMALFLLLPEARRLADFLVLNRPVAAAPLPPLFPRPWLDRCALALRTVLVIGFVALSLVQAWHGRTTFGDWAPKAPFHGLWEVEEMAIDGEARPPLVTDAERWHRVVFNRPGTLAILTASQSRERYVLAIDETAGTFALTKRDDPAWKHTLAYREPEPGRLTLAGTFDGHEVRAALRRVDDPELRLTSRGFHWINEYPFNR